VKSGLVALVGRPNVGKSTLLNALLGQKVAIMSAKPQTTRSVIHGVLRRDEGEAVLVDTPGVHKPRTLLGQRLNDLVRGSLAEVDLICLLVDAAAGIGRGDRFLAAELAGIDTPKLAVVNKMDSTPHERLVASLQEVSELGDWAEIVPVSALTGQQLDVLTRLLFEHLPEGEPLFPEGQLTDEPERHFVAEVIREKAIAVAREELPHSIAVVVEEMGPPDEVPPGPREVQEEREPERAGPRRRKPKDRQGGDAGEGGERPDLLVIRANLFIERSSQKPIVLGRGGSVLRDIGTRARRELEQLLGTRVYLDLHVKVAKEWQRDPKQLARLGY
jgi:GTP-binding protein Era